MDRHAHCVLIMLGICLLPLFQQSSLSLPLNDIPSLSKVFSQLFLSLSFPQSVSVLPDSVSKMNCSFPLRYISDYLCRYLSTVCFSVSLSFHSVCFSNPSSCNSNQLKSQSIPTSSPVQTHREQSEDRYRGYFS